MTGGDPINQRGSPLTHIETAAQPNLNIRDQIIAALSANGGKLKGSSYICLLDFLEPKMRRLQLHRRELRREIGAEVQALQERGELWQQDGAWRLSERLIVVRRRDVPRGPKGQHKGYRNDRSYHGRPKRDRRLPRIPASTAWA